MSLCNSYLSWLVLPELFLVIIIMQFHVFIFGVSFNLCFVLQCIIDHQALSCLLSLLTQNHKKSIKKEACWTVSNITAGNKDQIQVRVLHMLKWFLLMIIIKRMTGTLIHWIYHFHAIQADLHPIPIMLPIHIIY